jgi:hypothetical protein
MSLAIVFGEPAPCEVGTGGATIGCRDVDEVAASSGRWSDERD